MQNPKLRLAVFAAEMFSRSALNRAGAEIVGGELRRRRALAYQRLFEEALDELRRLPSSTR
ncbi:MAG: hypothetical protein AAGA70_13805 [Pseudomonadota bacterium]